MELRDYQQDCLTATLNAMRDQQNVLVQAATGAGKTIFFSALIKYCMEHYKMRIGVVAHREQLVRQARDKLLKYWPEGVFQVGIACASVSNQVDLYRPVIIASPQTLARRINDMPPLHLLIVDECHRLPPANKPGQYTDLVHKLREYYPDLRLLGVTATPFRLNHGYIYGDQCKSGAENWFENLTYSVSIKTLQDKGYLSQYRAMESQSPDLGGVQKSGGEFNLGELGEVMSGALHVGSAVKACQDYAPDRQHIVVFAVTIEHAEILCKAFRDAGYTAACVHSKMPQADRLATLDAFDRGKLQVVCNVGVLTEGWDCTCVDCMVMCRPTLSPALYVQMVGRGLRLHPGKEDCLLLDLSGNWSRHGDPNDPEVNWRERKKRDEEEPAEKELKETDPVFCPKCGEEIAARDITCPACGTELVIVENGRLILRDAKSPWTGKEPLPMQVCTWQVEPYTSRAGNYMLRIAMSCQMTDAHLPVNVNHFLDIEGQASDFGQRKAMRDWQVLAGTSFPFSVDEAVSRVEELHVPDTVWITRKNKYYNVAHW